jgi:signal transduction histidine kinase/FixJ family two-component response regulator
MIPSSVENAEVIASADLRLSAHYAVTRVLAESATIQDASSRILQLICETLGWDLGEIWRLDRQKNEFYCQTLWHVAHLDAAEFVAQTQKKLAAGSGGLPGRVLYSGRPVWIENVAGDPELPRAAAATAAGIHTAVAFPIQLGRNAQGAICLFNRREMKSDHQLLQMLSTIGQQMGQFIERMSAEEERANLLAAEQYARRMAEGKQRHAVFLSEASALLASSLDYQTTLGRVVRLAVSDFADWCMVDIVDENHHIHRVAIAHADPAVLAVARSMDAGRLDGKYGKKGMDRVMKSGAATWVRNVSDAMLQSIARDAEHLEFLRKIKPTSCIVAPMTARERTLGVITFVATKSSRTYSREDVAFAKEVARRAAVAVDNARLYKEAQAARESAELANRLKDEFLANLSHELRTPLTPMLGWVGMLRTGKLESKVALHGLHVIERNIKTQTRLIDDLLDVSRIVTGKFRMNIGTVSISALIQQAVESVQPAADAKKIRLELSVQDPETYASGDVDRLQQVMWNLLSNAIKFTPVDGEIKVCLLRHEKFLKLTVTDNGDGIEPAFLPFVFERFRQADSTATRRYGGLGLGLSIVQHIVELHGGSVIAESAGAGKGAVFTVSLPVLQNSATLYLPTENPDATGERRLDGIHVLVVDDQGDTLDWIAVALKQYGAKVSLAPNAAIAARIIETQKPDVMIADVGLPGEDGFSLISRIRAKGSNANLPAIALTAYAQNEDKRRALDAGFHVHLSKPIEPEDLANAVIKMVEREIAELHRTEPRDRPESAENLPHTV